MSIPAGEPTSGEAVSRWIQEETASRDRFARVYNASEVHRERHGPGCTVYPTSSGPLLGVLAAATRAKRILEIGCGLGYSALWLAYGSSPDGIVETIEQDPDHAMLAGQNIAQEDYERRVVIREGRGARVLPQLTGFYDLIFCDADIGEYLEDLNHFFRLLRPGGLLVSSNLFLGQYAPELPGLDQSAIYRLRLLDDERLLTSYVPGGLALSVLRS